MQVLPYVSQAVTETSHLLPDLVEVVGHFTDGAQLIAHHLAHIADEGEVLQHPATLLKGVQHRKELVLCCLEHVRSVARKCAHIAFQVGAGLLSPNAGITHLGAGLLQQTWQLLCHPGQFLAVLPDGLHHCRKLRLVGHRCASHTTPLSRCIIPRHAAVQLAREGQWAKRVRLARNFQAFTCAYG